eukprot:CAMPEP_0119571266 /NCGR_PEP_ID=MMETSP1352-20130426/44026_1 /TAXON_ID=265584 /ORGANISM="Stauroneis constricta, Strain CCMP1120" /LENGTH=588 /DNA_ID=CAMNT_0007620945 /DNA_START=26 /DNA_END=1789 /DNA_ORIENTATION=-
MTNHHPEYNHRTLVCWILVGVVSFFVNAIPGFGEVATLIGIIVVTSTMLGFRYLCVCCAPRNINQRNGEDGPASASTASSGDCLICHQHGPSATLNTAEVVTKHDSNKSSTNKLDEMEPLASNSSSLTPTQLSSRNDHREDDGGSDDNEANGISQNAPQVPNHTTNGGRVPFLDNIKTFLTMSVVTFHVICAFGGAGSDSWFLIVGLYDSAWHKATSVFVMLNQMYFMSLFFFISGYFVPSSYERKGKMRFLQERSRRLWIPALAVTFILIPICFLTGRMVGRLEMATVPHPGHGWFLYWLLLLNWAYASIVVEQHGNEAHNREHTDIGNNDGRLAIPMIDDEESDAPGDNAIVHRHNSSVMMRLWESCMRTMAGGIPKFHVRMFWSWLVCGVLMLVIQVINVSSGTFASMPLAPGSLSCDLFMFLMGILAGKNGWFSQHAPPHHEHRTTSRLRTESAHPTTPVIIREQLGIPIVAHRMLVAAEGAAAIYFLSKIQTKGTGLIFAVAAYSFAGMYCVDMSLAVLDFFQQNMNWERRWTRAFSDVAYSVYILHPIVIVAMTAICIRVYEGRTGQQLEFHGFPAHSRTEW